ncbi:hypothetical protein [Corynebacterium nuruki]|uniref:hypothetical protein n=1 Tax=Corynebacterium nuruki TaxID=1032851 RepID=UPI0002485E3F|nr:hypothetical protein [Corynebacterium nuruki]
MTAPDRHPLNPVEAEGAVWKFGQDLARGIRIVSDAEKRAVDAQRAYDRARAAAQLAADGKTVADRDAQVELATSDERDARDVASLAFADAKRTMKMLETRSSGAQSILKSLMQAYATAGTGER